LSFLEHVCRVQEYDQLPLIFVPFGLFKSYRLTVHKKTHHEWVSGNFQL